MRGLVGFVCIFLFVGIESGFAAPARPSIHGQVVDNDGKPLVHANVLVFHAGVKTGYSTYCPSCYADCRKRVVTKKDGSFTIADLSPDLWFELLAVQDGYVATFAKHVDPDKDGAVTIAMAQRPTALDLSGTVRGRVLDAGGSPVRDAVVNSEGVVMANGGSAYGSFPGLDPVAVTNRQGEFEISYAKPTPKMLLSVEARGMAPKFVVMETGEERHTVSLPNGAAIVGRLLADGKPVANAEIGLIAKERGGFGSDLKIEGEPYEEIRVGTKSDGTFSITNVPEPVNWYVYAKMGTVTGGATVPMEVKTSKDNELVRMPDILVTRGYSVKGKVRLSDKTGVAIEDGMRVTINSDRAWDSQTVALGSDGSFAFDHVPEGMYHISPSVKGYDVKRDPRTWETASTTVDQDLEGLEIVVYPRAAKTATK